MMKGRDLGGGVLAFQHHSHDGAMAGGFGERSSGEEREAVWKHG